MVAEYGKSIIMDYSYKYFYGDGYGKIIVSITSEQVLMIITVICI